MSTERKTNNLTTSTDITPNKNNKIVIQLKNSHNK